MLNSLLQLTCCRNAKYWGVTNHIYMQAVSTCHLYVAMLVCGICHRLGGWANPWLSMCSLPHELMILCAAAEEERRAEELRAIVVERAPLR